MSELNKAATRNSSLKGVFDVEDPLKAASELAHILLNLRHWTRLYDRHFGYHNKDRKRHWEAKADRWISQHVDKETIQEIENIEE
jgi:hypothetical protein